MGTRTWAIVSRSRMAMDTSSTLAEACRGEVIQRGFAIRLGLKQRLDSVHSFLGQQGVTTAVAHQGWHILHHYSLAVP